jgi:hypothetical protein
MGLVIMADKRKLYLKDLLKEIDKVQKEINATKDFEPMQVGLHNGLTMAKAIAYRLAVVEE